MMIHDFDMARFLMGDEVEEIYTAGGVMVDPAFGEAGDLDTALVVLRFKNRHDRHHRQQPQGDVRVRPARGDSGQQGQDRDAKIDIPNQVVVSSGQSIYTDLPLNFFMDRYHGELCAGGCGVCSGGDRRQADAGDGRRRPRAGGDGAGGEEIV